MPRLPRIVVFVGSCVLVFAPSALVAQPPIHWWVDGNSAMAGHCFGNCGAGCSGDLWGGFPAPCGGDHYWRAELLAPPQFVEEAYSHSGCYINRVRHYYRDVYKAWARYVYHGQTSIGCAVHDDICADQGNAACFWSAVLVFGDLYNFCYTWWPGEWSYQDWVWGWTQQPTRSVATWERCIPE